MAIHFMRWNLIIMTMAIFIHILISCLHHDKNLQLQYNTISITNHVFSFCWTGETATTYHFKTLVPSVAAGAIIGKGGETIAALQKDAGARVKMSKSHDFYPGT